MQKSMFARTFWLVLLFLCLGAGAYSQSSDQSYPTPVTTNEINGEIKARDVGDPRQTTYFYAFSGSQGDIFVNVVSKNFNGDVDIFIADGLRPLSKIVIYADSSDNETGRVIYLRKPEKLILRVEGRTPNDDSATFKIKFAGSFVAAVDTGEQEPELPEVKVGNESGIRVNSVGTIIERVAKAKPTPKPAEEVAAAAEKPAEKPSVDVAQKNDKVPTDENLVKGKTERKKVEVIVSENIPESKPEPAKAKNPPLARTRTRRPVKRATPVKKENVETPAPENASAESEPGAPKTEPPRVTPKRASSRTTRVTPTPKAKQPDPLESIHLVILFKDGTKIEKPMSEVLRFTVDRGILTVISKDGTIGRYPILEVLKTTIE